jgi:NTP pyrophosphatase (non-canonical NTP hydrolase)
MNLDDYAIHAMTFRLPTADTPYVIANLVSEVGEFFGHMAKFQRDGGDEAEVEKLLKKELGDILWHIAAIAEDLDSSLEEVANINIEKLTARKAKGTLQGSGDTR